MEQGDGEIRQLISIGMSNDASRQRFASFVTLLNHTRKLDYVKSSYCDASHVVFLTSMNSDLFVCDVEQQALFNLVCALIVDKQVHALDSMVCLL